MERWHNKIAVVTGASSGIGWAIAQALLAAGMQVVGLARRLERMLEARSQLANDEQRQHFHPLYCDLNDLASIKQAFQTIETKFDGRLHVLINNAGMSMQSQLLDVDNEAILRRVIDVNLLGVVHCTKQAYRLMQRTITEVSQQCHVINVNSLLGHTVPKHIPGCGFNLYPVAKHAVRALNEVLRREFYAHKHLLRLSNISPGLTETEFGVTAMKTDDNNSVGSGIQLPNIDGKLLQPEDVARAVCFMLSMPAHANIAELLVLPTCEEY